MSELTDLIRAMPKAELHLHIEGTLEPEMAFDLARRNGVALRHGSVEALHAAYRFRNLQDFLDIYYQGMSVLRTEQDFHDLTAAYLERARRDNVVHAEIFFDPQGHTRRGVPFQAVIGGITRALGEAEKRHGITWRLIMCFLRDLDEEGAAATLEEALKFRPAIHGIGLDSGEVGNPPAKFQHVYARARAAGLRCVAHAGEEGPASYVREALDVLKIERIDHGNRSLDDAALVARLRDAGIGLTVCPLSNLKLGVVKDMKAHPLREMLRLGLRATVNSDDPAYFGGYINDNFLAVADATGLTRDEALLLAKNSFAVSFLDEAKKKEWMARVDELARHA